MIAKTKWIERKFDFTFPLGLFPCILERLRGTPARLFEMTGSMPDEIAGKKMNDGWSIKEHIGHLSDLEELHEGRIDDFLSGLKTLCAADMQNRKTYQAGHNSKSVQALLNQFRERREKFVKRLGQLSEKEVSLVSFHPRLKQPMRLVDMAFFTAEHDDHHLASVTELIETYKV